MHGDSSLLQSGFMSKKTLSRQRLQQIKNNRNGMCQSHKYRPLSPVSKSRCQECLNKGRNIVRAIQGSSANPLQREDWDKLDFSEGPQILAKRYGYSVYAVLQQMKKRGWRKIYIGPHQMVVDKDTAIAEIREIQQASARQKDRLLTQKHPIICD
jgi:hypothetical protein